KKEGKFELSQIYLSCTNKNLPLMTKVNLFSQIISKLDRSIFKKLVESKATDKHQKGYNSWTQLIAMLFCQFAKSGSVRDISNGLRSATGNLNHLGIQRAPSKSTIRYARMPVSPALAASKSTAKGRPSPPTTGMASLTVPE